MSSKRLFAGRLFAGRQFAPSLFRGVGSDAAADLFDSHFVAFGSLTDPAWNTRGQVAFGVDA